MLGVDDKLEETDCSIDLELKIGTEFCSRRVYFPERCQAKPCEGEDWKGTTKYHQHSRSAGGTAVMSHPSTFLNTLLNVSSNPCLTLEEDECTSYKVLLSELCSYV